MHLILFIAVIGFIFWKIPKLFELFYFLFKYVFLIPLLGLTFGGFTWCVAGLLELSIWAPTAQSFLVYCGIATVGWFFIALKAF